MQLATKLKLKLIGISLVAIFGLSVLSGGFEYIDDGNVGLKKTFGAYSSTEYDAGLTFKAPFVTTVDEFNVRTNKYEADASAVSKDMQKTHTKVAVNYNLPKDKVYEVIHNVGSDYESKIIVPAVQEIVKSVTAKYSAEELVTKREDAKNEIKSGLTTWLQKSNLAVTEVSVMDFQFSNAYQDAIEAKQVAEQKAKQANYDLERVKVEAEQKVATAEGEAKALSLKKQSLTPELIELEKINAQVKALDKWNGILPQITGGSTPFVNFTPTAPAAK